MAPKKKRQSARKQAPRPLLPTQIREAAKGEIDPAISASAPMGHESPSGWLHYCDMCDNPSNTIPGWNGSEVPKDLPQLAEWATRQREIIRNNNNWGGVERPGQSFPPPPDWQDRQIEYGRGVIRNIYAWLRHHEVGNRPPEIAPATSAYTDRMAIPVNLKNVMGRLTELVEWLERNSGRPNHSPDFRSVIWYGTPYTFTALQAACVKILWQAWENRTPEVGDAAILQSAESSSDRLSWLFRDHSAWDSMIVPGSTKGTHRLADPPQ
jgi:hypothetical protein